MEERESGGVYEAIVERKAFNCVAVCTRALKGAIVAVKSQTKGCLMRTSLMKGSKLEARPLISRIITPGDCRGMQ